MSTTGTRVRIELEWEGEDKLRRYLTSVLPEAFEESVTAALLKSAEEGRDRAKQLVPVDTGALRDSIRVERFARPAGNILYTGIAAGGYKKNRKTGRLVDYAIYVEYGTRRMRPRPYLRPASEWAMKRVPDHFWKELSKRVEVE